MTTLGRWLRSDQPVLGFSDATTAWMRRFALGWSLLAVTGLFLSTSLDLVQAQPGRSGFASTIQPFFMIGFVLAVLIAWKWEIVGGTLASFTAAGLAVFALHQLETTPAVVIAVGFLLPGLVWVLVDLHDFRPAVSLGALALVAIAVAGGAWIARDVHQSIFGPSHPSSTTQAVDSAADWVWVGAVTESSAVVVARVPGEGIVELAVSPDPALVVDRQVLQSVRDEHSIVRFEVVGLEPDTDHHYALVSPSGAAEPTRRFRTFPAGPASFTFAVSSCARVGSNGAVFDAIAASDPLLYLVTGDLHYANIDTDDASEMRRVLDLTLSRPAPAALYRSTAVGYVWDDHDYGGDGSDRTSASRSAALETYRQYVPHYPLQSATGPIQQAFTVGRVRFILTDVRSERSPAAAVDDDTKTMLGAEQRAWLEQELLTASQTHGLVVWVNPVPWVAEAEAGADHWGGYTTERRALADFIAGHGISNLMMVSGDAHMLAIDDGTNSDYSSAGTGGFPVVHAAALDRPGKVKGGPYSEGAFGGSGQFATVEVVDSGDPVEPIEVRMTGWNWEQEVVVSHTFVVPLPEVSEPVG